MFAVRQERLQRNEDSNRERQEASVQAVGPFWKENLLLLASTILNMLSIWEKDQTWLCVRKPPRVMDIDTN